MLLNQVQGKIKACRTREDKLYMKKLLLDILLFLKILLQVKQELLKIKVMDGSWGWFPTLLQVYWVGGEDRSIHFKEIGFGQGATMALPIWGNYMRSLYENPILVYLRRLYAPENLNIPVDCQELANVKSKEKTKPKDDLEALGF